MKAGKEPLRSFSDLMQFYGLGQQPGSTEQGRGKKNQDKRGKDAGRRKDQGATPQEPQVKTEGEKPLPEPPPAETESAAANAPRVEPPAGEPAAPAPASACPPADQTAESASTPPAAESPPADAESPPANVESPPAVADQPEPGSS
jgi:hypothetical protein